MPSTLGDLLLSASARYGNDVALQIRRGLRYERISYAQAADLARRVAAWSIARRLAPGDRVAVRAPNMPEYVLLYFGAWLAGLVLVPIDVRTRPEVARRIVTASGARLAFGSRLLGDDTVGDVDTYALDDLLVLVGSCAPLTEVPAVAPDAPSVIVYTSGTTGDPKGVVLTHANLIAETNALGRSYPLRRGLVALSILPLSHIYELSVTFLHGFTSGVRVTYLRRVNPATIAHAMTELRVEGMTVVPEVLRMMLRDIEHRVRKEGRSRAWALMHRAAPILPFALRRVLFARVHGALGGRLDFVGVGGAPLDLGVAGAWERMGVHVFEGYGLTESSGGATINRRGRQRLGSAGRVMPGIELRCDEDGEILIAGPTVMAGYEGDAARTAEAVRDGWLRTGDVGRIDRDGFLFVTGRTAFRIVLSDGRKVYPEDVERELNGEAAVRDSCVIGARDERGRERVHAVLLVDDPAQADAIVRRANVRLADHQQIRTWGVWPHEDFPRGPTLKPDRLVVREAVERGRPVAAPATVAAAADPLLAALARSSGRPAGEIGSESELEGDLGLDSVGRIELLALLEEEMGIAIDEIALRPQTTVGELRRFVADAEPPPATAQGARWPRSWWARLAGDILFWIACRIQDRWLDLEIVHRERAARMLPSSLIVFNYQAPYAGLVLLRAMPRALRHRVAVAADAEAWSGGRRWQGWLIAIAIQAFPMVKTGGASRASIEEAARWLDDGYAVLLAPEGGPSMGEEAGEFLHGIGMLAVETGAPIVPFRLEGYSTLYPRHHTPFPWLPEHRGRARLTVGEPLRITPGATPAEATEIAKGAIFAL